VQRAIEDAVTPDTTELVLDATIIRVTSVTVLDTLAELDRTLAARGVRLEVTGLAGDALVMARRTEWWQGLERDGRVRE
jgi:MFS superfamily sulfate permease-like transporter